MLSFKNSNVTLLTSDGVDSLTIHVPAVDIINRVTEGKLNGGYIGTDIFGSDLCFEVKITKGCGEQLAKELGLVITKRVDLCGL